jgi:hypothetical protein
MLIRLPQLTTISGVRGDQPPGVAAAAIRATKSVGPPHLDQVVEAGVIVVESAVERTEGARIVA